jgi:hypothetical protein
MNLVLRNQEICIGIVLILIIAFYGYEAIKRRFANTHDCFAGNMLAGNSRNAEIFWFMIWFLVSAILGVMVPFVSNNGDLAWYNHPNHKVGVLITFNYTFIVPMLVGAYVGLLRETNEFFDEDNLRELGIWYVYERSNNRWLRLDIWNIMSKLTLFIFMGLITYAAVKAIIGTEANDYLKSPWAENSDLTISGVLYYALRGVNAYMALGLIYFSVGVFVTFTFFLKSTNNEALLDKRGRVKPNVHRLTLSLAACALLGPLVTVLHGIALLMEERVISGGKSLSLSLLIESTWLYWVVLAFLATCFLLLGIIWFHRHVSDATASVRDKMEDEIEELYESSRKTLEDYQVKLNALEKINQRINVQNISPIPKSAVLFVAGSFVIQAINILAAIKAVVFP